jgi:hypothetical protein
VFFLRPPPPAISNMMVCMYGGAKLGVARRFPLGNRFFLFFGQFQRKLTFFRH